MPRMQLNSKFVNNMLLEWSRFITEVKLNRGLKESNFDQLYAYLKQHEVHANENRTMMERFLQPTNDPLALIESLSNSLALLTQSYKSHLPQTNNQLRMSSNARNKATVQGGRVVVQDVRGRYNANNQGRPFQRNNARGNVVAGNDSDYFNDKMLLIQAQENSAVLDEEQSLFLVGEHVTNFDDDVDDSPENDLALNVDHIFEADQCDAFDVDEAPNTMFMVNLSSEDPIYDEAEPSHDSNTPFEGVQSILANKPDMIVNHSVTSELARYKELVGEYEKRAKFELTDRERKIDEQMRIIISDRNRKETSLKSELHSAQILLSSTVGHYKSKTEEVKINLYVLTQLFTEFDKTCKTRITPTGVIEGERGFEQTKRCYLTEVIPFFKTLKEHLMEEIFDLMSGEVDQNTVDKQCRTGHPLVFGIVQSSRILWKSSSGQSDSGMITLELCDLKSILHGGTWTQSILCSRSTNLYTISIDDMMKSSPICLLSKASNSFLSNWKKQDTGFSHKPKSENTIEVLHTLYSGSEWSYVSRVLKGKMKYILVIVDDYSRFAWVKFLRSKDETPEFVINFLKQIQVGLNKTVRFIRTDNGTEFVNQVMSKYYEGVGIFHQKSVPRTPQQNGVVERRNRTLVEVARTMMIFSKAPIEDLGKFQAKADLGIFVGYAPSRKGYRIYNKRTRRLMETIHVTFDEMHQSMAPVRISSGPEPIMMTPGQLKTGLAPTDKELEMLFQPMFDEYGDVLKNKARLVAKGYRQEEVRR
ncbi:retrovirus-related pol polyprotein from transposon TNT 1-94 [Tanacetum coccineum]